MIILLLLLMAGDSEEEKGNALLTLAFDDVENDLLPTVGGDAPRSTPEEQYHMISRAQAEAIADFYFRIKDDAARLICQCEHGQSRSAAVAAAILEYRSHSGITVFAHDCYYPNKVVFRRVLSALRARGEPG